MTEEGLLRTAESILRVQRTDGAIPWFEEGIVDPWDHVEAAMGLNVAGAHQAAERAFHWLANQQHAAGYWLAAYDNQGIADDTRAESNFVAYIATGLWHHFRTTGDRRLLDDLWPTLEQAIDFVLTLQAPTGEIYWALDTRKGIQEDALITGCSATYHSLRCASAIAATLNRHRPGWTQAARALGHALRHRPDRFDRTWESKARFSMDWFYPVLAGVVRGAGARARLNQRWDEFVVPDLGCRCVADRPWVTVAETCELVLACLACGQRDRAERLFQWIARFQSEDGSWWTGYVFEDDALWPVERPTWTAGAVLLAQDALQGRTPAADFFRRHESAAP